MSRLKHVKSDFCRLRHLHRSRRVYHSEPTVCKRATLALQLCNFHTVIKARLSTKTSCFGTQLANTWEGMAYNWRVAGYCCRAISVILITNFSDFDYQFKWFWFVTVSRSFSESAPIGRLSRRRHHCTAPQKPYAAAQHHDKARIQSLQIRMVALHTEGWTLPRHLLHLPRESDPLKGIRN